MKNNKSGFTIIELFIAAIPIGTIIAIIVAGCFVVKGCNYVCDKGIKNVAEDVWSGGGEDNGKDAK